MIDVAAYVQAGGYAKPAYKIESYEARVWPGLELILADLRAAGHEVVYASSATVAEHRILLVSITSMCDWWSYLAERATWPRGKYRVIVGGPGVLNIRPFLDSADVFVFGRGEGLIRDLVAAELRGERLADPSIAYADEFDPSRTYLIRQAPNLYPAEVTLANGKQWRESGIGCQRKCLFCGYTWHRRHLGERQERSGAGGALWSRREVTLFDLDLTRPAAWQDDTSLAVFGLDGFSERLRGAVAKPITRDMLRLYVRGLIGRTKPGNKSRIYNIVGYPTETRADASEFFDICRAEDGQPTSGRAQCMQLHHTPFRPMPATPLAVWPIADHDFRSCWPYQNGYNGIGLRVFNEFSTDSLATVMCDAIVLRATESDAPTVRRLAGTRKYWASDVRTRVATLRDNFDMGRLMGRYTWEDLPTRYLRGVANESQIRRAEEVAWRRLGLPDVSRPERGAVRSDEHGLAVTAGGV